MDYQRFIEQLPELYEDWGKSSVHPKAGQFQSAIEQVQGMTTANVMQLLNWAVECTDPREVYCQIGCFEEANLIGALLNHPEQIAYAVDNFYSLDEPAEIIEKISKNISKFDLDERVFFCLQHFEEFFQDLKEIKPEVKIGVYFYNGITDYRSQLLGLMLVKPFLASKALIIVNGSKWSSVKQAVGDFMTLHPQCKLLLDLPTAPDGYRTFWNGIYLLSWDVNQSSGYPGSKFVENFRPKPFREAIDELEFEVEFKNKLEALEESALSLEESQQFVEAEEKYKEILQWDRNNAKAYHNIGVIYYRMSRYKDALAMLRKALSIDEYNCVYHYSLGLVLEKMGDASQAINAYEKAIALNPHFSPAYNNLGKMVYTAGEFEQAESIFRQGVAANPTDFGSYLNLGNVLLVQQKVDEAIECYEKSFELNLENHEIIQKLKFALDIKHEPAKQENLNF